jgi:hypothetical protein
MNVKYVKSVILNLPNFNGSTAHNGGQNINQYIYWYKTNEDTDFIGLDENEAIDLLILLKSSLVAHVKESTIEDIDVEEVPTISLYLESQRPYEYELSKIINCKKLLGFDVKGYIPN